MRSLLCLPLSHRTKLLGVLYLENGLTPHAFTPARATVLAMLASQAAISLENSQLFAARTRAELELDSRLRYMTMLSEISARFSSGVADEIDTGLRQIGEFFGLEGVTVFWVPGRRPALRRYRSTSFSTSFPTRSTSCVPGARYVAATCAASATRTSSVSSSRWA